jgi:hypothetical protein
MTEQIWYKDPAVLFTKESWYKFVPMINMPVTEALNAVLRFTIYFTAIMALTTGETQYFMIIPVVMLATALFDQILPNGITLESFSIKTNSPSPSTSGYTMPSNNNPFMNVLLTEITDNPNRGDAAPTDRRDVREKIVKSFQHTNDIYMDTTDLFDQRQAMRTFHTIQSSTVPNNLEEFKKWLAKGNDAPDFSSAPPARNGKLMSEGYVEPRESLPNLPNSTSKPTGTSPSPPPSKAPPK